MKRIQSRRPNGRWQRSTLENTFGLSANVCPDCGSFNPCRVGEPKPETCRECGRRLAADGANEPGAS